MRTYDYLHSGLTAGDAGTPGNVYSVMRTQQKINGMVDGWIASKQKAEDGSRMYVRQGSGSVAYFGRNDMLKAQF